MKKISLIAFICTVLIIANGLTAEAARKKPAKKSNVPTVKKVTLLCPLDLDSSISVSPGLNLVEEATSAMHVRLNEVSLLRVSKLHKKNPCFMRAIFEGSLSADRLEAPYNELDGDARRAVILAREWGADYVGAGSIAAYTFDEATHTVNITLTYEIIDVVSNKSIVMTSAGAKVVGSENESEASVALKAVSQAAETMGAQLKAVFEPKSEEPQAMNDSKPKR